MVRPGGVAPKPGSSSSSPVAALVTKLGGLSVQNGQGKFSLSLPADSSAAVRSCPVYPPQREEARSRCVPRPVAF